MRLHCGQKCSSTGALAAQVRHSRVETERSGMGSGVTAYAPKDVPQPQVCFAFGLLKTKPLVMRDVS